MGFTYTLMSVFFEEFKIPANPLTFVFEIILLVLLGIPRTIGAIISYVYFPSEPKSVEGKVILITGTGRGNGRELALQFHRLGAKIACVDKDAVGNNETVERITEEGGQAVGFTADISDKEQVTKIHAAVRAQMGPVDILVNNAAVIETTLFVNPEADQMIRDIVDTNLLGQIWVIREILPSMLERNSGHIVTISSMMALKGLTLYCTYAATKYALTGMMESLTRELKLMKSDVITTTVCPYFIANCTDRSSKRLLRVPELPLEEACELIVEGILRNDRVFTVPDYDYFVLPFIKFLPEDLQNMIDDIFYTSFVPNAKEAELLRKYTKIAEMKKPQTLFFAPCLKMGSVLDEDE